MTDALTKKQTDCLTALTTWVARVAAEGHAVPAADEITAIAVNYKQWNEHVESAEAHAWSPTIEHLVTQVKCGVNPAFAVDQLPVELLGPASELASPASTTPAPPATEEDLAAVEQVEQAPARDRTTQLTEELIAWRAAHIARGTTGADTIKDATLKGLVRHGHTSAEQIGKRLGSAAAMHLAPEIASVIANFDVPSEVDTSSPTATQPEPLAVSPLDVVRESAPRPESPSIRLQSGTVNQGPRHTKSDGALLDLTHDAFCAYAYEDSDVESVRINIKAAPDGGVSLSFEPHIADAGKMVIYRVVSGENYPPFKPEAGEIVAVTTGLQVEDSQFLTSAVRHYQVWCHVGLDEEDACRAQPFKLATGAQISPVEDFQIVEDEGRVIGHWSVLPGTDSVEIYRIPLSGNVSNYDNEQFRICADALNLNGFVDDTAERGQRYLYRAQAKVTVDGAQRLSDHRQQEWQVSVVLQSIDDLEVLGVPGNDTVFDLCWSVPDAGEVRVYRLKSAPPADLAGNEWDEAALQPQGFTAETRINYPVTLAGPGKAQIRGVPWPSEWRRAYIVPVTVLNGLVRVGRTQITNRMLPPVRDAKIIERYDTEIVTFGWPEGAVSVKAFVGLESMNVDEICGPNAAITEEITQDQWERDGGLTFANPLAANGCRVCLVPVAYSAAQELRGEITTLQYPGLARVDYWLIGNEGGSVAELVLQSNVEIDLPPAIMLINNESRFPLSPDDGRHVDLQLPDRGESVPQFRFDRIPRDRWHTRVMVDLSAVYGYYRLFFGPSGGSARPLALHDPPPGGTPPTEFALWRGPQTGTAW